MNDHEYCGWSPAITRRTVYMLPVADLRRMLGITESGELGITVTNGMVEVRVKS